MIFVYKFSTILVTEGRSRLPAVFTESRDEVTLLMFGVEKENGPLQRALLIYEDLSPGDLLRAEAIQAELRYHRRRAFVLIFTVGTAPLSPRRLHEFDASILCIDAKIITDIISFSAFIFHLDSEGSLRCIF